MFIFYAVLAAACYLHAKRHRTDRAVYALATITAILFGAAAIMTLIHALWTLLWVVATLAAIWHFFLRPALTGKQRR